MMQMQQQMMGKAGGAAPQQGMGAMNPMAAMMGGLLAASQCAVHAVEDFMRPAQCNHFLASVSGDVLTACRPIRHGKHADPCGQPTAGAREGDRKCRSFAALKLSRCFVSRQ